MNPVQKFSFIRHTYPRPVDSKEENLSQDVRCRAPIFYIQLRENRYPLPIPFSVCQQVLWRRAPCVRGQVRRVREPEGGGAGAGRLLLQPRLQEGILLSSSKGEVLSDNGWRFIY